MCGITPELRSYFKHYPHNSHHLHLVCVLKIQILMPVTLQGSGITKRPLFAPGNIIRWSDFYTDRSNDVLKPAQLFRKLSTSCHYTYFSAYSNSILRYFSSIVATRPAAGKLQVSLLLISLTVVVKGEM